MVNVKKFEIIELDKVSQFDKSFLITNDIIKKVIEDDGGYNLKCGIYSATIIGSWYYEELKEIIKTEEKGVMVNYYDYEFTEERFDKVLSKIERNIKEFYLDENGEYKKRFIPEDIFDIKTYNLGENK